MKKSKSILRQAQDVIQIMVSLSNHELLALTFDIANFHRSNISLEITIR
jgi:hypothetical protein